MDNAPITVIDYGMGNIGSLENMVRKVGGKVIISSDYKCLRNASKLILPGVGAFDNGVKKLKELELFEEINYLVLEKQIPILCICLGVQLICKTSDEGSLDGFGWLNAEVVKFNFPVSENLKIPHMGWNDLKIHRNSMLFWNLPKDPCFYFVHSFHLICNDSDDIIATSFYGYDFVAAIQRNNIFGTQFHPEKSHRYGMQIIRNFVHFSC